MPKKSDRMKEGVVLRDEITERYNNFGLDMGNHYNYADIQNFMTRIVQG